METKLWIILILGIATRVLGNHWQDEEKLHKDMLNGYNSNRRPYVYANETVHVQVGLDLIQIVGLDESKQVLQTVVWFYKIWKDVRFSWDPNEYGGITKTRLPPGSIWKPDIMLLNNARDTWGDGPETEALIFNNGELMHVVPIHVHSSCLVDLLKFPYDTQTCQLKFGSWTHDAASVDINFYMSKKEMDLQAFVESNEWEIIGNKADHKDLYYACCEEAYPRLAFTLTLKRRSAGHYTYTLIAPSIILAMLIPIVFLLPTGTSEKTSLGVGVILGLILLAIMIQNMLPRTGYNSFSALAVYNLMCVTLTAISLAFAALINSLFWRSGDVPSFIRSIVIDKVGRLVCVSSVRYRPMHGDGDSVLSDVTPKPVSNWKLVAIIMDRLLLVIFLFTVVIITVAMHN